MNDSPNDRANGSVGDDASERHSRLLGIKLRALVAGHLGDDEIGDPVPFAPGAALLHRDEAWVLLEDRPGARLGASIAWALRGGAGRLNVVAEADTGVLARRAAAFTLPISVWGVVERELIAAVAEPFPAVATVPAEHDDLRAVIAAAGVDPVVEHGVLFGEVRGLEVCRVVDDPVTGRPRLEVGVGVHDREAFQMLHGDVPPADSLARVADVVARHRASGAARHPLNQLAVERFVRWTVIRTPELVGAVELAPSEPPVPRPNLKDPVPCVAAGRGADGEPVVVVCSAGVDLDLVPYAADARLAAEAAEPGVGRGIRLVVVTSSRDRLPIVDEIAALLGHSLEFASID